MQQVDSLMLDITQLSAEIHLSVKSIRTLLSRQPNSLPPRLIIPGQRRLLWLREDVQNFYRAQTRVHGVNPAFTTTKKAISPTKRRGAPTMAERLARARNG